MANYSAGDPQMKKKTSPTKSQTKRGLFFVFIETFLRHDAWSKYSVPNV